MYVDNLLAFVDRLDHMGDKSYGVTGTLRQNRSIALPLPNKKKANKELKHGEMWALYNQDSSYFLEGHTFGLYGKPLQLSGAHCSVQVLQQEEQSLHRC